MASTLPTTAPYTIPEVTLDTYRSGSNTSDSLLKSYQGQYLHQIQNVRHLVPHQHESQREYLSHLNDSPPEGLESCRKKNNVEKRKRKYNKKTSPLKDKGVDGNEDLIRSQKLKHLGNESSEYSNLHNNFNDYSKYSYQQNNLNTHNVSSESYPTLEYRIKGSAEYLVTRNVDESVDTSCEVDDSDVVNDNHTANNTEIRDHQLPSSETDESKLLGEESNVQDKEIENIQLPECFQQVL